MANEYSGESCKHKEAEAGNLVGKARVAEAAVRAAGSAKANAAKAVKLMVAPASTADAVVDAQAGIAGAAAAAAPPGAVITPPGAVGAPRAAVDKGAPVSTAAAQPPAVNVQPAVFGTAQRLRAHHLEAVKRQRYAEAAQRPSTHPWPRSG